MNTPDPTVCPKCGYARAASDAAPDWQCPSCGIAYNKFQAAAAPPASAGAAAGLAPGGAVRPDNRVRLSTQGQGNTVQSGGIYLLLVGIGIFAPFHGIWPFVLPFLAAASFYYWLNAFKRKRLIEDVPTSRVATAAQGYVELTGTVAQMPGRALSGPLTKAPCAWYLYSVVEGEGKHAKVIERGSMAVPFLLRDETGECLVNPADAEVLCDTTEKWDSGNVHYMEWSIRAGDPIYAIGGFSTDATHVPGDLAGEANAVLRAWLADPKGFFTRFDGNRDGKIAAAELARAREAARSDAAQRSTAQGGLHMLKAPADGRPFILVNLTHAEAASRFAELTWVHLAIFFVALAFLAYNLFW